MMRSICCATRHTSLITCHTSTASVKLSIRNALMMALRQLGNPPLNPTFSTPITCSIRHHLHYMSHIAQPLAGRNAELVAACREQVPTSPSTASPLQHRRCRAPRVTGPCVTRCAQEELVRQLHGELSMPHTVMLSSLGFALCEAPALQMDTGSGF